jgi:transcriptional regulator of acetoin/glycerol metabolism
MQRLGLAHHAKRIFAALSTAPDHDLVADSWRRCLTQYDLDPEHSQPPAVLSSAEVREARGRVGRIARVSDPELDRLYDLVAPLGYAVLMTDAGGLVIASRFTRVDESAWRYWRLRTGAIWNEALEGTNGVGTCLADQHPITVHRDQHFRSRYLGLSCTAAPLFDATGRLAGALAISSYHPEPRGRILPLALAATRNVARRIEDQCFRDAYANSLIVSLPEAEVGMSVPLVALNAERQLIGATRAARDRLAIDDSALLAGVELASALEDIVATPGALKQATRGVLADALTLTQGNVSAAARALGISRATMHRKMKSLGLASHEAKRRQLPGGREEPG